MSSGVVVERNNDSLYVKVKCKDRRGLLADVLSSLRSFPLEITSAAVTSTPDGFVHDVFQVNAPTGQVYSEEEILCHMLCALYPSFLRAAPRRQALLNVVFQEEISWGSQSSSDSYIG